LLFASRPRSPRGSGVQAAVSSSAWAGTPLACAGNRIRAGRWSDWRHGSAALLAALVFSADTFWPIDSAVAVLYVLVLLLAAPVHTRRSILLTSTGCAGLLVLSFALTHASDPSLPSILRGGVSLTAIGITTALLIGRLSLEAARRALEESQARLQQTADSVPHLLWQTGTDGRLDFLNRRWTDLTGTGTEEALREEAWLRYIHPDDVQALLREWNLTRAAGCDLRTYRRLRCADGAYRWMHIVAVPHRDQRTGGITRWYGGATDVDDEFRRQQSVIELNQTLEQRVEQHLRELARTEWRYRSIFEQTHIALIEQDLSAVKPRLEELRASGVTDFAAYVAAHPDFQESCLRDIRTVAANRAAVRLLAAASAEALMQAPNRLVPSDSSQVCYQLLALFEQRTRYEGRGQIRADDGHLVTALLGATFPSDPAAYDRVVIGLVDITEHEAAQEALASAQADLARASRVVTLGTLSASLAHDLNQPLGAMVMNAQTSLRWLRREPPDIAAAAQAAERAVKAGKSASDIVRRTRDRLTRGERQLQPLDLLLLLEEAQRLMEREVTSHKARLLVRVIAEPPRILANRVELQQVLINLMLNGLDAMHCVPVARRQLVITIGRPEEQQVCLQVRDHGPGIPPEHLKHLFDPFFTTKEDGMGMGLAICRSVVEAHGGSLAAWNDAEGGAVFEVVLPIDGTGTA
jgi:PAS domain S-box-containing protein